MASADGPFSYVTRPDGTVVIHYGAAPLALLRGKAAIRFTARIAGADALTAQLLMARATRTRAGTPPKASDDGSRD